MIVVIEDSATQRMQLVRDVRSGGWEVVASEDGESGLERIRSLDPPPLAVVTDILMPGIDGWEVCRRIKADPRLERVAVVVLTQLAQPTDVLHAVMAGADNYCMKPYTRDTLIGRIQRAIDQVTSGSPLVEIDGEQFPIQSIPPRLAHILAASLEDAAQRYHELAHSRAELEKAYADREAMTRMIVHELRSPLQAMLAAAQLSQKRAEILTDLPMLVERQSHRIKRILDDLSDVSKIELGQLPIEVAPNDLVAVLSEAVERLRPSVPTHHIELSLPPGPLPVRIDAGRTEQILTNLVTNAAKYSPDADRVVVNVLRSDGSVRVEIRDWGIGVDPENRERIFERYFRATSGESTSEGLGIGLFVTRHLVRAQGGDIGVRPAPDQGSIFWFELPLEEGGDAEEAREPGGGQDRQAGSAT